MKKSTKIFSILLVSLITLVSVVCVTAFATEAEETLDITLKKNIAVTDKIQAMYAVKADENITAKNTTLTVYDKDPEAEGAQVVWSGYGVEENLEQFGGDKYIVFYTNRVALYAMAEFFYVQVESNGVKSDVETYSVAEYLFDRLYKDGFVNKTEADGKNYSRKTFYEDLVRTGKSSFEVLTHDVEKSIADLAYVYVDDATLADGSNTAVVNKGESVTLATLPAGYMWKVTSYADGVADTYESKESALTLNLDSNMVVTLVGDRYYTNAAYPASSKYSYDGMSAVTKDNYLTSGSVTGSLGVVDGVASFGSATFALKNSGNLTGTKYVFETDIYFSATTATKTSDTIMWMGMSSVDAGVNNGKASLFAHYTVSYTTDENTNVTAIVIKQTDLGKTVTLDPNKWYNIRIEYTPTASKDGKIDFYLDDVLAYSSPCYGSGSGTRTNEEFESFAIEARSSSSSGAVITTKLDNTFIGAVTE